MDVTSSIWAIVRLSFHLKYCSVHMRFVRKKYFQFLNRRNSVKDVCFASSLLALVPHLNKSCAPLT